MMVLVYAAAYLLFAACALYATFIQEEELH